MATLKYLSGAVFMLKLSFLYPFNANSKFEKVLLLIWRILYLFSFLTTFIQCAVYLYKMPFNLIEESMVIMNTVIYFSLFINFTFLFLKKGKLYNLVNKINHNFADASDNEMEHIDMTHSSKLSDKFAYYWSVNCIVASLMPTIASLVGRNRILPILSWIPYNYEKSPFFELTYIWQIFCLTTLGTIYAVLDLVFPCIAILMGQQFKILSSNLKNNINKALLGSNISETDVLTFSQNLQNDDYGKIFEMLNTKKFKEENLNYLRKNIRHHQLLLQYCEDLNDILSTFLLGKISAAIFNTLFMAFSLITTRNQALIFGLTTYVMSTSTELFIYTYSGQILTQNADMLWTLYESPWYMCDSRFQKTFQIVQMRAHKMVYTKAGNYFSMSASSFITFMKALGSYVALLKELTEREK